MGPPVLGNTRAVLSTGATGGGVERLSVQQAGVYRLSAVGRVRALSSPFVITHAAPRRLRFAETLQQTAWAGQPLAVSPTVELVDDFGNIATTSFSGPVGPREAPVRYMVSLVASGDELGDDLDGVTLIELGGTVTTQLVNGIAVFDGMFFPNAAEAVALVARPPLDFQVFPKYPSKNPTHWYFRERRRVKLSWGQTTQLPNLRRCKSESARSDRR